MRRHHLGGDDPERWTLKCPVRQLAQAFGRIDLHWDIWGLIKLGETSLYISAENDV